MNEDRERAERILNKVLNETAANWLTTGPRFKAGVNIIEAELTAVRAERDEEWAKAAEEILSIGHTPQHFGGEEFQAKFQSACARLRAFAEGVKG